MLKVTPPGSTIVNDLAAASGAAAQGCRLSELPRTAGTGPATTPRRALGPCAQPRLRSNRHRRQQVDGATQDVGDGPGVVAIQRAKQFAQVTAVS